MTCLKSERSCMWSTGMLCKNSKMNIPKLWSVKIRKIIFISNLRRCVNLVSLKLYYYTYDQCIMVNNNAKSNEAFM